MAFSAVSCYPLPSPTHSINRYGLDATLIDASSGEPFHRRNVSVVIGDSRFDKQTSRNGSVRVSALRERHWTWLGGPAWGDADLPDVLFEIDGFESTRIESSGWDESRFPTEYGRIQAGRVIMKRLWLQE